MIQATCSVCGKSTKGGVDWAGRKAQCPICIAPIVFPAAVVVSSQPPAPPTPPQAAFEIPDTLPEHVPTAPPPREQAIEVVVPAINLSVGNLVSLVLTFWVAWLVSIGAITLMIGSAVFVAAFIFSRLFAH